MDPQATPAPATTTPPAAPQAPEADDYSWFGQPVPADSWRQPEAADATETPPADSPPAAKGAVQAAPPAAPAAGAAKPPAPPTPLERRAMALGALPAQLAGVDQEQLLDWVVAQEAQQRLQSWAGQQLAAARNRQPEPPPAAPPAPAEDYSDLGLTAEEAREFDPRVFKMVRHRTRGVEEAARKEIEALKAQVSALAGREEARERDRVSRELDGIFDSLAPTHAGTFGVGAFDALAPEQKAARRQAAQVAQGIQSAFLQQGIQTGLKQLIEMAVFGAAGQQTSPPRAQEAAPVGPTPPAPAPGPQPRQPTPFEQAWARAGTAAPTQRKGAEPKGDKLAAKVVGQAMREMLANGGTPVRGGYSDEDFTNLLPPE